MIRSCFSRSLLTITSCLLLTTQTKPASHTSCSWLQTPAYVIRCSWLCCSLLFVVFVWCSKPPPLGIYLLFFQDSVENVPPLYAFCSSPHQGRNDHSISHLGHHRIIQVLWKQRCLIWHDWNLLDSLFSQSPTVGGFRIQ